MVPDLLHPNVRRTLDLERTKLSITLAFAGGVSGGLFGDALGGAALAESTWDANAFASDLFLHRFVSQCFRVQIGHTTPVLLANHLLRLLSQPPADPNITQFRRLVLDELVRSPELRHCAEQLYLDLYRFRGLLENAAAGRVWDANRRKLDVLALLKRIIDRCAADFGACASGLARLGEFGQRLQASEPYRALADLLRYDGELATVNLKLAIGADGKIRGFALVSVAENATNPFVNSVWRRWLAKIELFVRGFQFGDAEIMARLIDAVFTGLEDEFVALVQLFGDLEFYLGALGFNDFARAAGLCVCLPEFVGAGEARSFSGLFNPLLLMSGVAPVPCDVSSDPSTTSVLVTGPNSGGKTRLLQAIGLSQLLAQSGLFVPARAARIYWSSALVVSLVEEAKADQREGRLGMELVRIRNLFERLPPGAMVLLDELCSGTNPSEGEQIFELVITMLAHLRPQVFITTHFLAFAARLAKTRSIAGLGFLQVELDAERRPTYQFVSGVAQSSLAAQTAERLGVTGEQLLRLIEHNVRRHTFAA